jgi:hypothetical protein
MARRRLGLARGIPFLAKGCTPRGRQVFRDIPVEPGIFSIIPDKCHFDNKTARQIKPLPANSRSSGNGNFRRLNRELKYAEPGIVSKNVPRNGRAPEENQKETHRSVPSEYAKI